MIVGFSSQQFAALVLQLVKTRGLHLKVMAGPNTIAVHSL